MTFAAALAAALVINGYSAAAEAAQDGGAVLGTYPRTVETQTAGRTRLGGFAPKFAELNDDVLFGQIWSRTPQLSVRDRSLVTIAALFSAGQFPRLKSHLVLGKAHGITRQEAVEAITQLAFYCGWPKAWSALPLVKEVYGEETGAPGEAALSHFPLGDENTANAKHFSGRSWVSRLSSEGAPGVYNVTFAPGVRNSWHVHEAKEGGGQILVAVAGEGWGQMEGRDPVKMLPGDTVTIPAGVKHWHGAARDSWFQHLAIEVPGKCASTKWFQKVDDAAYNFLK
ncbi:MAG: carboxymuconolactone decarboxylase family protein [Aeromonadales bacterium]|nr:carboxymuconolactone decarboxylase family protein [Aeromonadales bacterium]MDY2890756.1 carboxymuconolactone decarboxylase family protein [Succinivibrio sp.]